MWRYVQSSSGTSGKTELTCDRADVMKLQIRVDEKTNKISDVVFKTFGCGSAIASSSYLTELVRGMTLDEAGKVKNTDVAKELCLPPVKRMSTLASWYRSESLLSYKLTFVCV